MRKGEMDLFQGKVRKYVKFPSKLTKYKAAIESIRDSLQCSWGG